MQTVLKYKDADIFIDDLGNGYKQITVEPFDKQAYIFSKTCRTDYPMSLIEKIIDIKGPFWVCDEIMRDQNSGSVENAIIYGLFSYLEKDLFINKRILDFGSGAGSSTMVLARMLPDTEFVGAELDGKSIELAKLRAEYYGFNNIKFFQSPAGDSLPDDLGQFDYIILNAVYEHLLPNERKPLLSMLWSCLKPDGVLFITETPHRYFFIDQHTTGLPFIAYMNDRLAFHYAKKFSKRISRDDTWDIMLRKGIRGGCVGEIMKYLNNNEEKPVLLEPKYNSVKNRFDLYYKRLLHSEYLTLPKRIVTELLRVINVLTGITIIPTMSIAIQKKKPT